MNKEFILLMNDYNSSDTPDFYDGKTLETLSSVVHKIHDGEYTEDYFCQFTDSNLGHGDFAQKCKDFVSYSLLFLLHSKS